MSLLRPALDTYRVLNVQRTSELEVIRAAYRALAWRHHPDHGGSPERMIAINQAWQVLRETARRPGDGSDRA